MKISIPEPCHQDWNAMTIVDVQRRHCAACDRTLTDFTTMTDAEIGRHLRRHSGKICGRIRASQLKRKLAVNGPRNFGGARAAAAAAGLLLTVPAVGQSVPPPQTALHQQVNQPLSEDPISSSNNQSLCSENLTITGVVTDDTGEPLIGASLLVMGTTTGTVTDIDGKYSLEISRSAPVTLQISYTGFATLEKKITEAMIRQPAQVDLVLELAPLVLDEVMVLGYFVPRRSQAHRVLVAPVNRYLIWPVKQAVRDIGEWRAGRFDRRAARQLRREERRAVRLFDRNDVLQASPEHTGVPSPKEVAPAVLNFKASPNPFTDHLRVAFLLPERGDYRLELYSAGGKLLGNWEGVGEAGTTELTLEHQLAGLPAGMYFLELATREAASVLTLVR